MSRRNYFQILLNPNRACLWINCLKFYIVCLLVCQVLGYQNILKLNCRPLAFTSYKAFLKYKERSGTSLSASFLHDFWRKILLLLYSNNWPRFTELLLLLREILDNICIPINCQPGFDVTNCEINLIFRIESFFLQDQNVKTRIQMSWERKKLLRWDKNHFSSSLKGFYWSKYHNFLKIESPTLKIIKCIHLWKA